MMPTRLLVLALLALGLVAGAVGATDVPMLSGRVVDNAEMLSPAAREQIAAALKAHEDATGNQIVVLTTPSLDGEAVDPYGVRVFETWKLGKKGRDNGLLLLAVTKERKIRIEVGYGLEGVMTDVVSSRIIRNVIAPPFKAGNFDQGMKDGVAAIIGQLEGKDANGLPGATLAPTVKRPVSSGSNLSFGERILFGVFIFGIIGLFTVLALMVPGVGWFMYLFLIPFWAMFPIAVVGFPAAMSILAIYVIAFPIAKLLISRSEWYKHRQLAPFRSRGSGMGRVSPVGGWSSSSDSGSWSSSSDSFSGSGGESGGGGSSGDY